MGGNLYNHGNDFYLTIIITMVKDRQNEKVNRRNGLRWNIYIVFCRPGTRKCTIDMLGEE